MNSRYQIVDESTDSILLETNCVDIADSIMRRIIRLLECIDKEIRIKALRDLDNDLYDPTRRENSKGYHVLLLLKIYLLDEDMKSRYQTIAKDTDFVSEQTNCEEIADYLARKFGGKEIKIKMLSGSASWSNPQTLYMTLHTTLTDWVPR